VGPTAGPLVHLDADGRLAGVPRCPTATIGTDGAFACDEDVDSAHGAAAMHLDADGSQRWGVVGAPVATMSSAGVFDVDGAITTGSTVEGKLMTRSRPT